MVAVAVPSTRAEDLPLPSAGAQPAAASASSSASAPTSAARPVRQGSAATAPLASTRRIGDPPVSTSTTACARAIPTTRPLRALPGRLTAHRCATGTLAELYHATYA